jgi:hypothetical protein
MLDAIRLWSIAMMKPTARPAAESSADARIDWSST